MHKRKHAEKCILFVNNKKTKLSGNQIELKTVLDVDRIIRAIASYNKDELIDLVIMSWPEESFQLMNDSDRTYSRTKNKSKFKRHCDLASMQFTVFQKALVDPKWCKSLLNHEHPEVDKSFVTLTINRLNCDIKSYNRSLKEMNEAKQVLSGLFQLLESLGKLTVVATIYVVPVNTCETRKIHFPVRIVNRQVNRRGPTHLRNLAHHSSYNRGKPLFFVVVCHHKLCRRRHVHINH